MKKLLFLLVFIPIVITLNSCASLSSIKTATADTNSWIEFQMLPSKLLRNGEVFFRRQLSDGSTFSVFSDDTIDTDQYVYYNRLMQDFGWTSNGDKWQDFSGFARRVKYGALYVNPKKRVAVYIYPKGTFASFKVTINN